MCIIYAHFRNGTGQSGRETGRNYLLPSGRDYMIILKRGTVVRQAKLFARQNPKFRVHTHMASTFVRGTLAWTLRRFWLGVHAHLPCSGLRGILPWTLNFGFCKVARFSSGRVRFRHCGSGGFPRPAGGERSDWLPGPPYGRKPHPDLRTRDGRKPPSPLRSSSTTRPLTFVQQRPF